MVRSLSVLSFVCMLHAAYGHGRLWTPPSRSSMFRKDFDTPKNWNDAELNCGGRWRQWGRNGGKCGPCGDPYDKYPRANEPGGRYYSDVIGKNYTTGETIDIEVQITANHRGYFVFSLCEDGMLSGQELQDCFDRSILTLASDSDHARSVVPGGPKVRYYMGSQALGTYTITAYLPRNLTCEFCVLQWNYKTANTWGSDDEGSGLGHGPQEHFINCANIGIGTQSSNTTNTEVSTTLPPCRAIGAMAGRRDVDEWCVSHCTGSCCPDFLCYCPGG